MIDVRSGSWISLKEALRRILKDKNNVNLDCMTVADLDEFIAAQEQVDEFVCYAKVKRDAMKARGVGDVATALRLERALDHQYKDLKSRGLTAW